MRHVVLALMIALLPIRGWMGDAMAVAMLAAPAHTSAQTMVAQGPAPCPDHAVAAPAADAPHHACMPHGNPTDTDSGEHAHKSCDVCNGPAMALSAPAVAALAPVHGRFAPPAEHFASSEPHRGIKPPIS